jgi:hypothetical protein
MSIRLLLCLLALGGVALGCFPISSQIPSVGCCPFVGGTTLCSSYTPGDIIQFSISNETSLNMTALSPTRPAVWGRTYLNHANTVYTQGSLRIVHFGTAVGPGVSFGVVQGAVDVMVRPAVFQDIKVTRVVSSSVPVEFAPTECVRPNPDRGTDPQSPVFFCAKQASFAGEAVVGVRSMDGNLVVAAVISLKGPSSQTFQIAADLDEFNEAGLYYMWRLLGVFAVQVDPVTNAVAVIGKGLNWRATNTVNMSGGTRLTIINPSV